MAGLEQSKKIILASESPLRKQLLQSAGLEFEVMASPYDEDAHKDTVKHLSVPEQALYLAKGKARVVSEQYPDCLVIAADQIGEFNSQPLFKPKSKEMNVDMLMQMQGQSHQQHCAACFYIDGKPFQTFVDSVTLHMRTLVYDQVSAYVAADLPLHCCGGYRYEGIGKYLFSRVEGNYESILGLPLLAMINALQDAGFVALK